MTQWRFDESRGDSSFYPIRTRLKKMADMLFCAGGIYASYLTYGPQPQPHPHLSETSQSPRARHPHNSVRLHTTGTIGHGWKKGGKAAAVC